jgi:hypothetical protein
MARKLPSWVDGFSAFTEKTGSPNLFRRWTGIFTVAAAMERKVQVITNKGALYPNLYVVLVGPAGSGKTVSTSAAYDLMLKLDEHHLAPTSVTKASMMDVLKESERKIVRPQDNPPVITFHSVTIMSNELGVLIPAYENDFINVLTDLYDNKRYSERRRTNKIEIELNAPQFNILAATTPSYLNNLMPEGAWDQGFISRTMLIYSGKGEPVDLFDETPTDAKLQAALTADLTEIGDMYGKMKFTDEAVEAFRAWMKGKEEPVPEHPKLQHYNSRRQAHLLKLCMIASASQTSSCIVTLDHYAEALDWLVEAESFMPDIFKSMSMGSSNRVMDETWYYAYQRYMKDKKPIPEPLLIEYISQRAPVHEVTRILEVMTKSGIFKTSVVSGAGVCYTPAPRRQG